MLTYIIKSACELLLCGSSQNETELWVNYTLSCDGGFFSQTGFDYSILAGSAAV